MNWKLFAGCLKLSLLRSVASAIIESRYGGFWNYKAQIKDRLTPPLLYTAYLQCNGAFVGLKCRIASPPMLPHGLNGIHISEEAEIGNGCVIFQQVTIGSNTLKGHKRYGSPRIGDNVYIGAGAKIIGRVNIGNNCRIGANCVVVTDMPDNTTAIAATTRFIHHDFALDNTYAGILNEVAPDMR